MIDIATLLGAAALSFGLARWTGLPTLPFFLLAGLGLGLTDALIDQEFVEHVLFMGAFFLLFVAGTDMGTQQVGDFKKAAVQVGLVQFISLFALGTGAALLLGYVLTNALYLGLALTASSTLVGVRLLQQRRQMFEPFGRLTIGVLLVQDLLVILLIPVLTYLPEGTGPMVRGVLGTLLLLGVTIVMVRWISPAIVLRTDLDDETLLLVILSILFAYMGFAWLIGVPLVAAAFLAGVALSGFPVSGLIHSELQPIADFFTAVFFVALGAAAVVPEAQDLWHVAVFVLLVILWTPPAVTFVAERTGFMTRSAIESGLLLSQTSEFSLIIGLQALLLGHIGADLFTIIALTTVITMTLTPFLTNERVVWRLVHWHPSTGRIRPEKPPRDHVLLLGCGQSTWPLLDRLIESDQHVVVVDEDPGVIHHLHEREVPCLRGDAADRDILREAGAPQARALICTIRRPLDILPLFDYISDDVPILVRVFEEEEAEHIRAHGGTPVLFSHAAADAFLQWFDENEALASAKAS